ncbi:MAG: LPS export ABC transporter periplasmic protein LptC [Candidatus Omnitrophica bacterium]|nr:LPS export ABC transporter periplasmic protein LptC [Candidatus Omnitrophota bacterium]
MKYLITIILGFLLLGVVPVYAQDIPQQFEGFDLEGYDDNGEKSWDVKGDTADIAGDTIVISNVDANQYREDDVNLKARTGILNKASGDIYLKEDVVITSETGSRLTTDSLDWKKGDDLVTTDDIVTLTDNGITATGTGLRASPGLQTAEMKRDVTVKVNTESENKDGKIVTITCDGPLEIDQMNNIAVLRENVVAVQSDTMLKADRMEVYFDGESQKIKELICIGNVVVTRGDNQTFSARAVYDAVTQKVTLSGRPKMIFVTEGEGSLSSSVKE